MSFFMKVFSTIFETHLQEESVEEEEDSYFDENTPEFSRSLVDMMSNIIKAYTGSLPRTTYDFQVRMFPVTIQRETDVYRVWWIPINHPLVSYLENHAMFYDPTWQRLGTVSTPYFGQAFVYGDHTIMSMFRELHAMFAEHGIEVDNRIPDEEEEDVLDVVVETGELKKVN